MNDFHCENYNAPITEKEKICAKCGYPQQGTKSEKIAYNAKLLRLKDLVEDSSKSVKAMLSFAIIFLFMACVVLLFSVLFGENHYLNSLIFLIATCVYFLLYRLGKISSYLMAILALFFYAGHTIFEFTSGIYLHSQVDLDKSFVASKGAALLFELVPMVYLLFRLALMIVLIKFLWTELRLKREGKMVNFIRRSKDNQPS